jgi:hypothetical protein
MLRIQLITLLVESGGLRDKNAETIRDFCKRVEYSNVVFDQWAQHVITASPLNDRVMCNQRLNEVAQAIDKWYCDHDMTLPESLDDLLETYLTDIPVHPFTGAPVEYYRNVPPTEYVNHNNSFIHYLARNAPDSWINRASAFGGFARNGGTYLKLGERTMLIVEPNTKAGMERSEMTE